MSKHNLIFTPKFFKEERDILSFFLSLSVLTIVICTTPQAGGADTVTPYP